MWTLKSIASIIVGGNAIIQITDGQKETKKINK